MGITGGLILTLAGFAGAMGCVIALILTGPSFKKQRRRLLEQIESE